MSLTLVGSRFASAADMLGGGGCRRLLTEPDSTHGAGASLQRRLDELKELWQSLSKVSGDAEKRRRNSEVDLVLARILERFPEARSQIRNLVAPMVSARRTVEKLTQEEVRQLTIELTRLQRLYRQFESESLYLRQYEIVGDSWTDWGVKWKDGDEDHDVPLQLIDFRYVQVPSGSGEFMSVDLRKEGGHTGNIKGARLLANGSVLSWSDDHTLIVWEERGSEYVLIHRLGESGNQVDPSLGHLSYVIGARLLPDGSILSWSWDHTLIVWEKRGSEYVLIQRLGEPFNWDAATLGHVNVVYGAQLLPDGSILSWSGDHTLIVWEKGGVEYVLNYRLGEPKNSAHPKLGHTERLRRVQVSPDGIVRSIDGLGRVLLWRSEMPQAIAGELIALAKNIENIETHLATAEALP